MSLQKGLEKGESALRTLAGGIRLLASQSGIPAERIMRLLRAPIKDTVDALAGIPDGKAIDPRFIPTLFVSLEEGKD